MKFFKYFLVIEYKSLIKNNLLENEIRNACFRK